MKKILYFLLVLSAFSQQINAQTVWTSKASGSWSSASTWTRTGSGGGTSNTPPNNLDNNQRVVITSGFTVTQSSNDIELNGTAQLTIENGGKLNLGNSKGLTQKNSSNLFTINNGTYENNSGGSGGNLKIEDGNFNWTNASVFVSGNLDFKSASNGNMSNTCVRVKQNTLLEGIGSTSSYANFANSYLITGISGSGNLSIKANCYLNVTNWRLKVGSSSGNAEIQNSTINGNIYSIDANDELKVTSLAGNPSLSFYCADKITPNLNSFTGTKTNNCATASSQTCTGIPPLDADTDGIIDNLDDFPTDQYRAFKMPFPSTGYATLMFEDLWPNKGDYDFNDLVIDYKYETVSNASNQIVEVKYTFVLKAIGAGLHNGFGFQLDNIAPNKITSISTVTKTNNVSWLSLNANGTETGQTFANIILYDDVFKSLPWPGFGNMVNVYLTGPEANTYVTPDTTNITISFLNNGQAPAGGTVTVSQLPTSAFNPYLICGDTGSWNQIRNKEIHLPNRLPSDKASSTYFRTASDDSNPATGKYYKTEDNLPWALEIFESIPYMQEKIDISEGYSNFLIWAESNGASFTSWYQNLSGNRVNSKLYIKP